jgi:trans-aconitate methyltransferase
MQCKVLKLVNGETIMGSILDEGKTYVDVFRPVKIMINIRGETTYNVVLMKWDPIMNYNTPSRIFKTGILSVNEPTKEFLDSYIDVYNEYDMIKENKEPQSNIETVDDLSEELDKLMSLMTPKNTSNTTFH